MKFLIAISAVLVIHTATCTPCISSATISCEFASFQCDVDTCKEENRAFAEAFMQEQRQNHCNAAGREGAEKAVYEIFYTLFDPAFLNSQGISAKPFQGPYYRPQTVIHFSVLPSKREFDRECKVLLSKRKKITNKRSKRPSSVEDQLLYFNSSKFPIIKIAPFFARTKFNADSVLYITQSQENQLLEFVQGRGYDTDINNLLSVISDGWDGLYLDRQLYIKHILFRPNLQRALVKVQSGTCEGTEWNILIERMRNGSWKVVALPHIHTIFIT